MATLAAPVKSPQHLHAAHNSKQIRLELRQIWIQLKRDGGRTQAAGGGDVLSRESIKPLHLRRHFTTKHSALKDKPVEVFSLILRKHDEVKRAKPMIQSYVTPEAKAQDTLHHASRCMAKASKPHTTGELGLTVSQRDEIHYLWGECCQPVKHGVYIRKKFLLRINTPPETEQRSADATVLHSR